jgi:hypothetical protein
MPDRKMPEGYVESFSGMPDDFARPRQRHHRRRGHQGRSAAKTGTLVENFLRPLTIVDFVIENWARP